MRLPILLSLLLLVGCQLSIERAAPRRGEPFELTPQGRELLEAADEYLEALVKAELIFDDPPLKDYLQGRLDLLIVDSGMSPGDAQIEIIKDPYMNAAMLPNGKMQLNIGILSRIHNEAQLMTLLGHEYAHYLFRHQLREALYRDQKKASAIVARVIASLVLLPTGLSILALDGLDEASLASIVAPQVAGYSRETESDADRYAFMAMTRAGYDAGETSTFFELMVADEESLERELNLNNGYSRQDPYYYANHPALVDRIELYEKLQAERVRECDRRRRRDDADCGEPSEGLGEARYMSMIRGMALENARLNLTIGRRLSATRIVERVIEFHPEDAESWALLGELRSARGSQKEAIPGALEALERALELDSGLAKAHRELGFLYNDLNRSADAIASFRRYLIADPEAKDRAIVERMIEHAE